MTHATRLQVEATTVRLRWPTLTLKPTDHPKEVLVHRIPDDTTVARLVTMGCSVVAKDKRGAWTKEPDAWHATPGPRYFDDRVEAVESLVRHKRADRPGAKVTLTKPPKREYPPVPRSYQEANDILAVRNRWSRNLNHGTCKLLRHDDWSISVRLHRTDIVTFFPDGWVRVDSGGWRTMTTSAWVTDCLEGRPVRREGVVETVRTKVCTGWRLVDNHGNAVPFEGAWISPRNRVRRKHPRLG